jgi:glutaminyl-peptide cyclotransferase
MTHGFVPRTRARSSLAVPSLPLTLALLLLLLGAACGGSSGPIDGSRAMRHVEAMVGFGPRPFGSEALVKTAGYLEAEIQKLGLEPKRHSILHEKEQKTIHNVWTQIDGEDPQNGPVLMLAAHYDTKLTDGHADAAHNFRFVGAIDGGGGPAVLLELARAIKARPDKPKCNIWLYWIDAEESLDWKWNDNRALLGSKAFCQMLSETKQLKRIKAFVLLDLIGSKNIKIDRDGNSDGRLQTLFEEAAKAMGESKRLYEFPTAAEVAEARRRGINWGTTDDHQTFAGYGVPSVLLIDFARRIPDGPRDDRYEQWWHTPDDDLAAMDPASLAFAGNLVMQALPALESFVLGKK